MTEQFVDPANTTRPDGVYSEVIAKIAEKRVCPFCPDHIHEFHKKPLTETTHWWVTENMYPYVPTLHHCLFIHKIHITSLSELSPEALVELHQVAQKEIEKRSIAGGCLVMRFGVTKFTGASVSHLHAHIVQSNPDDPEYNKTTGLLMRIG